MTAQAARTRAMGRFHPAQALLLAACTLLLQLGACTGTATSPHRRQLLQQAAGAPPPPPAAAPSADAPPAGNGTCCQQLAAIGFSSNLPVVVLDTRGAKLEEKGKDVNITLCTCNSGGWPAPWEAAGAAGQAAVTSNWRCGRLAGPRPRPPACRPAIRGL